MEKKEIESLACYFRQYDMSDTSIIWHVRHFDNIALPTLRQYGSPIVRHFDNMARPTLRQYGTSDCPTL